MEFKELKQQVNNMGLEVTRDENSVCIFNDKIACSISEKVVGVINTDYSSFWALPIMIRKQLMTTLLKVQLKITNTSFKQEELELELRK